MTEFILLAAVSGLQNNYNIADKPCLHILFKYYLKYTSEMSL